MLRNLLIVASIISAPPADHRADDAAIPQIQFCHPVAFPDGGVDLGNPGRDDA